MVVSPQTNLPDERGRFGDFGGKFVPETVMAALTELEDAYRAVQDDASFAEQLDHLMRNYAGRPTALYYAENLSRHCGGARIYLKREDLAHTGAHKINNALGQCLLAQRMGKQRIIAETGAGQHGVATATVCAMLGLQCIVYMGVEDTVRQALNVYRMRLLGAEVIAVESGTRTLKDAINEAIRDWVTNVETTHYLIGSVVGPHPYPMLVRDFQSVIGREARHQILEAEGRLPEVVSCVRRGWKQRHRNLLRIHRGFRGAPGRRGSRRRRRGNRQSIQPPCRPAGPACFMVPCHISCRTKTVRFRRPTAYQRVWTYPGVGPEHSWLKATGRAEYLAVTDDEALEGFRLLCRTEGIIPALESAHAIYHVSRMAADMPSDDIIVVCLSGRGDKDVPSIAEREGIGV